MRVTNSLTTILSASLLTISCSSTPPRAPANEGPEPQWHVMLLPTCPSETKATRGTPGVFKALTLLGVNKLIDRSLDAMRKIAKEDAEGMFTPIGSGGFLWWQDADKRSAGVASCVVLSQSSSSPAQWCAVPNGPFKSYPALCSFFEQLQTSPQAGQLLPGHWQGSALPRFYAEIKLAASDDQRGVMPTSVIYYYPAALHDSRKFTGNEPRSLSLTVSTEKVIGGGAATGTLVAMLKNIRPSAHVAITRDLLPPTPTGWVPVLERPEVPAQTPAATATPMGLLPVNIKAEVREIGKPNVFIRLADALLKLAEDAMKQEAQEALESRL